MNLFFINQDPVMAAMDLADKHVVKMLLECCQMMSTAAITGSWFIKNKFIPHPQIRQYQ